jgi:type I site-specific restriction-modification system R (restriction) subunit
METHYRRRRRHCCLDRIIVGVCEKKRFLDLFENFILFDNSLGKVVKLIARNHQFIGVNKAIENIQHKEQLYKLGKISLEEKQKLGVFWHTQEAENLIQWFSSAKKFTTSLQAVILF